MQTNGPGIDGQDPPGEDGLPPSTSEAQQPRPARGGSPPPIPEQWVRPDMPEEIRRNRDAGPKALTIILIIVVGIPVGLFVFGALLFGACMLGM